MEPTSLTCWLPHDAPVRDLADQDGARDDRQAGRQHRPASLAQAVRAAGVPCRRADRGAGVPAAPPCTPRCNPTPPNNPHPPLRRPRPRAEEHLAAALRASPPDRRLILVLSGWLGLRSCETAGLRWESIRLDGPAPLIIVAWDTAKGRKERVLPLTNPWVIAEFRPYGLNTSRLVSRRRDAHPAPNSP